MAKDNTPKGPPAIPADATSETDVIVAKVAVSSAAAAAAPTSPPFVAPAAATSTVPPPLPNDATTEYQVAQQRFLATEAVRKKAVSKPPLSTQPEQEPTKPSLGPKPPPIVDTLVGIDAPPPPQSPQFDQESLQESVQRALQGSLRAIVTDVLSTCLAGFVDKMQVDVAALRGEINTANLASAQAMASVAERLDEVFEETQGPGPAARVQLDELERRVHHAETRAAKFEEELVDLERLREADLESAEAKIVSLKQEREKLDEDIRRREQAHSQTRDELRQQKAAYDACDNQREAAEDAGKKTQMELQKLQSVLDDRNRQRTIAEDALRETRSILVEVMDASD